MNVLFILHKKFHNIGMKMNYGITNLFISFIKQKLYFTRYIFKFVFFYFKLKTGTVQILTHVKIQKVGNYLVDNKVKASFN